MKKGFFLLLFSFLFYSFSYSQYVTLEGRQFKDENGNDFYPVVCNFSTEYLFTSSEPFFPSPGKDHDGNCYDCNSFLSCLEQFSKNFDTIRAMNFNAIRLYMINPVYYNNSIDSIYGWALKTFDYEFLHSFTCWVPDSIPESAYTKAVYLSQSFGPDTVLDRILQYYDSVLLRAARSSLKVLLNVGVANGNYSSVFRDGYGTYLALVADHFGSGTPVPGSKEDSIRKAIMAYVILEEPSVAWNSGTLWPSITTGHSKQDVCQFISSLYDTLKRYDPHHLVTLGGVPHDLFEFDPGVMKLDFYCPHIYPMKSKYMGDDFFHGMVDEAHSWFYWLANNVPMPYLIGETGFKSRYMDDTHVGNDGTNIQQRQYADSTLRVAKDCNASGYSWWYYQDYYWGKPHDCFYGLLGRDINTYETERKPVVEAFESFDPASTPGTMTRPASYYDPFNHEYYGELFNYGTSHHLHGHVQDSYGDPIKDVYIRGQTRLSGYGSAIELYTHYTFTDESGDFVLIPFDYDTTHLPNSNVIETLKITRSGCTRIDSAKWDPAGLPDNQHYILDCYSFAYYDTVNDMSITFGDTKKFQAWERMILFDNNFVYGNGEFVAREEIKINSEFHAFSGSETWIHNELTFPVCDSIQPEQDLHKLERNMKTSKNSGSQSDEIELSFILTENVGEVSVFPNPSNGIFTVLVPEKLLIESVSITIYDENNRQVAKMPISSASTQLSMTEFAPGVYYIFVINDSNTYSCKLIIY